MTRTGVPPVLVTGATGRRLLRQLSSVSQPTRGASSSSHHRSRPRTLSSSNRTRWRCSTPALSGSSRPPGSRRRSSGRGFSRRTRCSGGRPRFAPTVSSAGPTALPRQHPSMTATWQPSRRGPCMRTGMLEVDYVLTGPESLSQAEQVGIIGDVLGRRVSFQELSPDEFRSETEGSWPRPAVDMLLAAWGATIGRPAFITSTESDILGSAPRSFRHATGPRPCGPRRGRWQNSPRNPRRQ